MRFWYFEPSVPGGGAGAVGATCVSVAVPEFHRARCFGTESEPKGFWRMGT